MNNWLENMESSGSSGEEDNSFETLIDKLRRSRRREQRNSEEKVTMLESLLRQQKKEIEDLRKTVNVLKAQDFQRKAKYEETSSAPSITSSEDTDQSESDFDDDDDEGIDSGPNTSYSYSEPSHPLLIDTILDTVMKHLSLKSLLSARLVCRKWYRFAHHFLVSKSDRVILEVHQPWKPSGGHKLSRFMQVMKGGIEWCPISRFVLRNFNSFLELEPFFRKFGPIIKSLDLNLPKDFRENAAFRRVLFDYAPCIENLRIECCKMLRTQHFWEYSELETDPGKLSALKTLYIGNIRESITLNKNWMKDFLRMSPNLRKLILQVHFKDNGHRFIQTVLEAMLEVANLEKIKFLFISSLSNKNLEVLMELAQKGLQLKTFKFQDICLHQLANGPEQPISPSALTNFLITQSECLETLKIEQRSNRIRGFQFPRMIEMRHLHLVSIDDFHCGCLHYSKQFPKLESLTLRGHNAFPIPLYFSPLSNVMAAGINVKKLSLPSGIRDAEFPILASNMFPNVTELEIRGASNQFLENIWRCWPNLEILKMVLSHFDGCLDSGLSGISTEECLRIRNEQNYDTISLDDVKTSSSITDLEGLRELVIECRSIWIPCHIITDVSGYLAFSIMKNLRVLKITEIGVPEHFDLSDACIANMHKNLKETEITLQIMDDHGRWRLELEEEEAVLNMYESEPLLEDHNKDKIYYFEKLNVI